MAQHLRWKWIGAGFLLGVAMLCVLILIDGSLKRLGVPGVSALQHAGDTGSFQAIIQSWRAEGATALIRVGFSLGWDYLFLLTYGAVFVLGGLKTRDDLFPNPGATRTLAAVMIVLMLVGTFLDAIENTLQFRMITRGADDDFATSLSSLTLAKWTMVVPCMMFTAVGALMASKRLRRAD